MGTSNAPISLVLGHVPTYRGSSYSKYIPNALLVHSGWEQVREAPYRMPRPPSNHISLLKCRTFVGAIAMFIVANRMMIGAHAWTSSSRISLRSTLFTEKG